MPGLRRVFQSGHRLTAETPLTENTYQQLGHDQRQVIDDAYKFGFLEIREDGLVIRPKIMRNYIAEMESRPE